MNNTHLYTPNGTFDPIKLAEKLESINHLDLSSEFSLAELEILKNFLHHNMDDALNMEDVLGLLEGYITEYFGLKWKGVALSRHNSLEMIDDIKSSNGIISCPALDENGDVYNGLYDDIRIATYLKDVATKIETKPMFTSQPKKFLVPDSYCVAFSTDPVCVGSGVPLKNTSLKLYNGVAVDMAVFNIQKHILRCVHDFITKDKDSAKSNIHFNMRKEMRELNNIIKEAHLFEVENSLSLESLLGNMQDRDGYLEEMAVLHFS